MINIFLITRYNVRTHFSGPSDQILNPEWLNDRRSLFENFCVPFVVNQTDSDFSWFILMDHEIPEKEAAAIAELSGARIVKCSSMSAGMSSIQEMIKEYGGLSLSVRLDSDDSIAPNYMKVLRSHAIDSLSRIVRNGRGQVFAFARGSQHDVSTNKWYDRYYVNNAFIGLLEPNTVNQAQKLVFGHAHYDMVKHFDVMHIFTEEPMWCIRVHGGNVANQIQAATLRDSIPEAFRLDSTTS
jgi:hypothetical protein